MHSHHMTENVKTQILGRKIPHLNLMHFHRTICVPIAPPSATSPRFKKFARTLPMLPSHYNIISVLKDKRTANDIEGCNFNNFTCIVVDFIIMPKQRFEFSKFVVHRVAKFAYSFMVPFHEFLSIWKMSS